MPRAPAEDRAGFHLSELYSPWRSWGELAEDWLKAEGQPERMRAFWNTSLAECWQEEALETPDSEALIARAEPYPEGIVPPGRCLLHRGRGCAGRPPGDGVGGVGKRPRKVVGPLLRALWKYFRSLRSGASWTNCCGRSWQACIGHANADSGRVHRQLGLQDPEVCSFTRGRHGRRIYSTKGLSAGFGKPIFPRRVSWTKDKYAIYPVAADEAKLWTASRLKIEKPGPGYGSHFPAARSQDQ